MILDSFIIHNMEHYANHLRCCAAWDKAHMHEAFTGQEWEVRRDNNAAREREARCFDHAAAHYSAMWLRGNRHD